MIRFVLSVFIVVAGFTLIVLPLIKSVRKGVKRGSEKIEQVFTDELEQPEQDTQS